MLKKRFLQIITGLAIVVCSFCLFAKSFLAVHYYPEGGAEVNLMFKLDPFGDNFVGDRDRFEADMQSPLRIYTDEMMVVGEETLKGISKVPLAIYVFCLMALIATLLKLKKPGLKKRWLIIPIIIIPIIIWIIWSFQSYNPSEAIEEQEWRREQAISDSLCWAREEREAIERYNKLPFISQEDVENIQPVLKKWADFYDVDLSQFRVVHVLDFDPYSQDPHSVSYREFTNDDDVDTIMEVDYSPDKQRYVGLGLVYEYSDGKWIYWGDDSQNIYLIDRKARTHKEILFIGASGRAEAVYWKGNDTFIIVGYHMYSPPMRFISVFDFKKSTQIRYEVMISVDRKSEFEISGYIEQVRLKEKFMVDE